MPITVNLDKPRTIRWTNRAEARLGSLERPPSLKDLAHKNQSKAFYALLAHVWAALEDRDSFADPESLADHFSTSEAQVAVWQALRSAFIEGGVLAEKKSNVVETTDAPSGPLA